MKEKDSNKSGCGVVVAVMIIGVVLIFALNGFKMGGTAFWIEVVALWLGCTILSGKLSNRSGGSGSDAPAADAPGNADAVPEPRPSSKPEDDSNLTAEQYLEQCVRLSEKVTRFMSKTERNGKIMESVMEVGGMEVMDNQEIGPYNPRLTMMVMHDVLKVYRSLGHELADSGRYMFPMTMIFGRIHDEEHVVPISRDIDKFRQLIPIERPIMEWVKGAVTTGFEGDTDFMLVQMMEHFDHNPKEYLSLLHDVATCIAKCYGAMSAKDRDYLDRLAKMQEEPGSVRVSTPSGESGFEQLDGLIGLEGVKSEVKRLYDFIKVQQLREKEGLKTSPISYHCVFTGNPGTGKTTVARIIADIYRELGILKSGHLVETDRSGMVAEYVGQTAVKTNKIIDKALDGVLFIDEAYSLVQGGNEDFGIEAIATLLKRMEDDRDRLAVVLAGYSEEMKDFINANPGLQSRFNRYIFFADYSADDLWQIFERNLAKHDYIIDDDAAAKMRAFLDHAVAHRDRNFGNARYVRNVFEKILENQAGRLAKLSAIDKESLQRIIAADIPDIEEPEAEN